jgi:holliday junction DNA helicase RuvA
MIHYLCGKVINKDLNRLVIEVAGVGYGVETLFSESGVNLQEKLSLWIYTRVKEDELKLFGFKKHSQRQVFEILLEISGVGPKVALAMLSSFTLESLWEIVCSKDSKRLESVPGVGKRTAEKMVLELEAKSKKLQQVIGVFGSSSEKSDNVSSQVFNDLHSALLNLGYKEKDITKVLELLKKSYKKEPLEDLLKKSFSLFSQSTSKKSSSFLTKVF